MTQGVLEGAETLKYWQST